MFADYGETNYSILSEWGRERNYVSPRELAREAFRETSFGFEYITEDDAEQLFDDWEVDSDVSAFTEAYNELIEEYLAENEPENESEDDESEEGNEA